MSILGEKRKALTSDDFGDIRASIDLPMQRNRDVFDFLHGREPKDPVHDITGIRVQLEGALYRTPTGRYQLEIRVGSSVYRVAEIQPCQSTDKLASRMTVVGPSESVLSRREKHAAIQQQADDIQAAEYRRQQATAIREREQREARRAANA